MDDDYYFDDMETDGYGANDYSYEEIAEYLENYDGELTPEMLEFLERYREQYMSAPADYNRISVQEMFENCVQPTCFQAIQQLLPLILMCFLFRLVCLLRTRLPPWLIHAASAVFGIIVLRSFFGLALIYLVVCSALAYFELCLVCLWHKEYSGIAGAALIVLFTISCEFLVEPTTWHRIRGGQIIISMKIISLAVDVAQGDILDLPNVFEYMGYCFNVGSVIFGPWISYSNYYRIVDPNDNPMGLFWLGKYFLNSSAGITCLIFSNCITHWIVLDSSSRWILAYRDAQSFRFSHYFVSFMSDATAGLSGLVFASDSFAFWNVARPQNIELPRSLVEVVTNWNLPMHTWLKTYVFKTVRPYGVFWAVLITYVASSLLHGLNFQLAAVLVSLGFYSYTEFVLRRRLSQVFDACIQAKHCKAKCDHKYTSKNPAVILANLAFGALSVFHLAYLGLMFDSSEGEEKGYNMWHTLDKWASLGFQSHWVALGTFIFYWLI